MLAEHTLQLKSCPESIAEVEHFVEQVINDCEVEEDLYGNILISLTEAVNNAIIHGNNKDSSKQVIMCATRDDKNVSFCITDEGTGFDPNNIPDPTAPENILKCGGRGVFLMRQLADAIRFSNNGRTVEMQFSL